MVPVVLGRRNFRLPSWMTPPGPLRRNSNSESRKNLATTEIKRINGQPGCGVASFPSPSLNPRKSGLEPTLHSSWLKSALVRFLRLSDFRVQLERTTTSAGRHASRRWRPQKCLPRIKAAVPGALVHFYFLKGVARYSCVDPLKRKNIINILKNCSECPSLLSNRLRLDFIRSHRVGVCCRSKGTPQGPSVHMGGASPRCRPITAPSVTPSRR